MSSRFTELTALNIVFSRYFKEYRPRQKSYVFSDVMTEVRKCELIFSCFSILTNFKKEKFN
jgi:hypothetical protein